MKNAVQSLVMILSVCILCTGCPQVTGTYQDHVGGNRITDYPSWVSLHLNFFPPATQWLDWQDEANQLKDFVPESIVPAAYTGKFRLTYQGQGIGIQLEDSRYNTEIVYIWLGEVSDSSDLLVTIPQSTMDQFEFSGIVKRNWDNGERLGQGKLLFTKIAGAEDAEKTQFIGKLVIEEGVLFEYGFTKRKTFFPVTAPEWFGNNYELTLRNDGLEQLFTIDFDYSTLYYPLTKETLSLAYRLPYIGGIKEVLRDDDKRIVRYELLDGPPKLPVYLEISRIADSKYSLLLKWYDKAMKLEKEELVRVWKAMP